MVGAKNRFRILIALVAISGFSQGMLLPLLGVILEKNGISSSVNGLHATGLYLGVLIASPFMEKPMKKIGFKPMILTGGILVFVSLALFPFWQALWFWFVLRVTIGIGDNMIHFGTQTWITSTAEKATRGRSIAFYGLSFSFGFMLGPLMTRFLSISEAAPFLISAGLSMFVWSFMFFVRNKWPEESMDASAQTSSVKRFIKAVRIAWIALLPGFGYGFLEATLHGIFPVYGLRIGHDVDVLSLIIPCFAFGSILFQIPLGILSDRIGRRSILILLLSIGSVCFLFAAMFETSVIALFTAFSLAGIFVGSTYSLGITYMTDLLPEDLLPAGNLLVAIGFSIGSISGPFLSGLFIDLFPGISFFYLIVIMLVLLLAVTYFKREPSRQRA